MSPMVKANIYFYHLRSPNPSFFLFIPHNINPNSQLILSNQPTIQTSTKYTISRTAQQLHNGCRRIMRKLFFTHFVENSVANEGSNRLNLYSAPSVPVSWPSSTALLQSYRLSSAPSPVSLTSSSPASLVVGEAAIGDIGERRVESSHFLLSLPHASHFLHLKQAPNQTICLEHQKPTN
jgi:hypothetical protein